jgi:maltose alpha-D-glucosyltransferase / alpha-amylase
VPLLTSPAPWYTRAVIYEVHVRAFFDSDGNGAGDFLGLIEKLDYIQDLGVTAIWLLPFCPSPWRDDGYDVSDMLEVHPAYGCLDDFQRLLKECKKRDLRVITELVLNHTSDEHSWFQRARNAPPDSVWRNYYVWSNTPDKYSEARIIFQDFETSNWTWDPVAKAYFWHRFYSHQPDLNYDNPAVRQAILETVDFWFDMGVDGLRLDAAPYLFEREGTTCENLPETHQFLKDLRTHVDSRYADRMLLAEANQWPEDAVAYFGAGDECHVAFNFPLMPRLFMATRVEDSFAISNIIEQTPPPPHGCQWATFLRNHDELTLEMVCAEERDFMYRAYAQDPEMRINVGIRRRLAPLLSNDHRRIQLMNALLFSLPGSPVLYYGDEIGMGEDLALGDRDCVRTPMQWSAGENGGFSSAQRDRLYLPVIGSGPYSNSVVNVEEQIRDPHSLLWWMRKALAVRRDSPALTEGDIELLPNTNRHILAFLRNAPGDHVLVIANLSRHAQPVQLALGKYSGYKPVETFGRVEFPEIGSSPYQFSLAPYGFYWFNLRPPAEQSADGWCDGIACNLVPSFTGLFDWAHRETLANILLPHMRSSSIGRPRFTTHVDVVDLLKVDSVSCVVAVQVSFSAGDPELQFIPLTLLEGMPPSRAEVRVLAQLRSDSGERATLYLDAANGALSNLLLQAMSRNMEVPTEKGMLRGSGLSVLAPSTGEATVCLLPDPPVHKQHNASVLLSDVYVLKLFRHLEAGPHPEIETGRYLFEEAGFAHVAPVMGSLEYLSSDGTCYEVGALHAFVENRTDLWQLALDELGLFLERASTQPNARPDAGDHSNLAQNFVDIAALLGKRTAQMHGALKGCEGSDYEPEIFDRFYLRGACHSMTSRADMARVMLENFASGLSDGALRSAAYDSLERLQTVGDMYKDVIQVATAGQRIQIHGDLHLGQVLYTGSDVVFIDFEGDHGRPLHQRRLKTSPLIDVAGLIHSILYVARSVNSQSTPGVLPWQGRKRDLLNWTAAWSRVVSMAFLTEYRRKIARTGLVPEDATAFAKLLRIYIIDKAVYQVIYELERRENWVATALAVLLDLTSDDDYLRAPYGVVPSRLISPTAMQAIQPSVDNGSQMDR